MPAASEKSKVDLKSEPKDADVSRPELSSPVPTPVSKWNSELDQTPTGTFNWATSEKQDEAGSVDLDRGEPILEEDEISLEQWKQPFS